MSTKRFIAKHGLDNNNQTITNVADPVNVTDVAIKRTTDNLSNTINTKVTLNGSLGTPSSGNLSNCTNLPISTGVSGLASNVATFLSNPTSANFANTLTDEIGNSKVVFASGNTGIGNVVYSNNCLLSGVSFSTLSATLDVTSDFQGAFVCSSTVDQFTIDTSADGPCGITLPIPTPGKRVTITNRDPSGIDLLNIYPSSGYSIYPKSVDEPYFIRPGTSVQLIYSDVLGTGSFQWIVQFDVAQALTTAQAAYDTANTKFDSSGGTISGDVIVTGNVTVQGVTTTLDVDTLVVKDKNVLLANVAFPTDVTADGAGLTVLGTTNKTWNWVDSTDSWTSSENINLLTGKTYKINGVNVITSTSLGSGVTSSSLTSVGTLGNLTVTNPISGSVTGSANVANYEVITNATSGTYYPQMVSATSGTLAGYSNNAFVFDSANGRFGIANTSPTVSLTSNGSIRVVNPELQSFELTPNTYANTNIGILVRNETPIDSTGNIYYGITTNQKIYANSTSVYTYAYGTYNNPRLIGTQSGSRLLSYGTFNRVIRGGNEPLDIANNPSYTFLYGTLNQILQQYNANANSSIVTGGVYGTLNNLQSQIGTIVDSYGTYSVFNIGGTTNASANATNYYANYSIVNVGSSNTALSTSTISNYYGLYLATPTVNATGAITNRWGIYQQDSAALNYFNGNVGIGITPTTYKLDVSGSTRSNTLVLTANTASTNTTTGTLVVTGGVGISGNTNITGNLSVSSSSVTISNGSFIIPNTSVVTTSAPSPVDITNRVFVERVYPTLNYNGTDFVAGDSITASERSVVLKANNDCSGALYVYGNFSAVSTDPQSSSGVYTNHDIRGIYGNVYHYANTNLTRMVGVAGRTYNRGTGTVGSAYSLWARRIDNTGGGVITNAHGLYVDALSFGVNNFGITSTVASAANNWNLYISGTANNYFAGNVGIGTNTPLAPLQVNGSGYCLNGTASTSPGIALIPSSTTGQVSTNTVIPLTFGINGTEKMRLDTSGNLTIGGTTSSARLRVEGTTNLTAGLQLFRTGDIASALWSEFAALRFGVDGTTGFSEKMVLNSAGNLGIGISSPSYKLDVLGSAKANTLVLTANTASSNTTTGTLVVTGGVGISQNINIGGTSTLNSDVYYKNASGNTIISRVVDTGNSTLTFSGNSGQLFSITDSLSGTIFAVNDISGVPSIEVDDDGEIRLAELFGNVAIGKSTANSKLDVDGTLSITKYDPTQLHLTDYAAVSTANVGLASIANTYINYNNTSGFGFVIGNLGIAKGSSSNTAYTYVYGAQNISQVKGLTTNARFAGYGAYNEARRGQTSDDISTNTSSLYGSINQAFIDRYANSSIVTTYLYGSINQILGSSGSSSYAYGDQVFGYYGSIANTSFSLTNHYGFYSGGTVGASSGTGSATVSNWYGLYLAAPTVQSTGTITNRYGVYQADSSALNYFNGNVGIGTSSPTSKLEISDSWNNSGTIYTGIKYNTINTASSSSSSLLDLQIDGTSRFKVIRGSGKTYINGNAITLYHETNGSFNSVISHSGNESLHFIEYGQNVLFLSGLDFTPSVQIPSNKSFGWSSSSSQSTSGDLVFYRDSAGVFAQRNGTNQQTYRLYSSYINSSNTSYVEATANTSLGYIINCANNGTQTIPPNNLLDLRLNSTSKFYINNSGGVYANTLVLTANTASTNTTTGTLVVTGGVGISGALNATTKSFDIVHPSNPDKRLRYGSLESPSHSVRLTGRSIVINGKATIELPYYLRDLVHEEDVNIQLTNIKHGEIIWVDEINISENYFTVGCKDSRELEFFWDITCERKDVDRLVVEE